ncbi:alpha/beta hydrolase [Magnetospirillum sp. 15-1]|uniref:alpha/beta hydrolase n=1 Tax=Magnetospirillum sp. 15-1 TaxID=1979370 RepID=UPI000BBCC3E6|nr:alpha/beta hydrolase [Magnetospirillum sp. 15-1]
MKLELLHCHPPEGPATGRPSLLFVHGSYCGAWVWAERFMPFFARRGWSSHAVSLRGHGESEGGFNYASLADYITDIHSAMEHVGGEVILVGHSMGGLLVQHCLAGDERVRAAVLMASVPPSGLMSSALHLSLFSPDVCLQFGLLQALGPSVVKGEVIRRAFFSDATPADTLAHLLPRLQKESHRICVELLNPERPRLPLGRRRPDILVMGGDRDVLVPTAALMETATYFDADLSMLAGAPHGLMLDDCWWQPTAERTLSWLDTKGF